MKHRSGRNPGFQPTVLIAGALLLLFVFVSVGFFFFLTEQGLSTAQNEMLQQLKTRREEWLEKRPAAFRYEIERDCECPLDYIEPFTVVEYRDDPGNEAWIDDFFAQLEQAIADGRDIGIRYDPRFSYPNDFHIADEQVFIRDFEVLEYD